MFLARLALVLIAVITAAACEDPLAPLYSTRVELIGPDFAYGEKGAPWYSRAEGDYFCEYALRVRAIALTEVNPGSVRWSGGRIEFFDGDGLPSDEVTLSTDEVERIFGYGIGAGSEYMSSRFVVNASDPTFRWKITLAYYDDRTGHTAETTFRSKCIVR